MTKANEHPWVRSYPETLRWDSEVPAHPVAELLERTVQDKGEGSAFDFLGKRYNWRELGEQVDHFAAALQKELGVGKGDKVGLFLPNTPYYLIAYYAALKIGAVVVNFNPLYAEDELAYQIEDSETDLMVTCDLRMLTDKTDQMLHGTRLKRVVLCSFTQALPFPKSWLFRIVKWREVSRSAKKGGYESFAELLEKVRQDQLCCDKVKIDPVADLAVLQYTGGTTGTPKGAMLTHQNVVANAYQAAQWLASGDSGGVAGSERMLGILPFFHVFAMTAVMNLSVVKGMEIVALPRFDLNQTLELIHKKKPHLMAAVPAIFNAINHHKNLDKYDLSSLTKCISGGAPLPVEMKKGFEEKTGAIVVEGYGLTESSPVLCCNPVQGENKAGSIGLPFPQTEIEIVDAEDKVTVVKPGERGELCAYGPQVMKGYWKNEEETASVLRPGSKGRMRLHTGDIAVMDGDGYFFIVDRLKDMIITNGYNVYPRNIEEGIYKHPAVEECVVAGIPDAQRGEIVKAWIKLKDGRSLTQEDLRKFLKDKLSRMEMPKRIEFRDEPLPKTMIGKLSRKDLVAEDEAKSSSG